MSRGFFTVLYDTIICGLVAEKARISISYKRQLQKLKSTTRYSDKPCKSEYVGLHSAGHVVQTQIPHHKSIRTKHTYQTNFNENGRNNSRSVQVRHPYNTVNVDPRLYQ